MDGVVPTRWRIKKAMVIGPTGVSDPIPPFSVEQVVQHLGGRPRPGAVLDLLLDVAD